MGLIVHIIIKITTVPIHFMSNISRKYEFRSNVILANIRSVLIAKLLNQKQTLRTVLFYVASTDLS